MPHDELDLSKIKTYSAASRASIVSTSLEGKPLSAGMTLAGFLGSLHVAMGTDIVHQHPALPLVRRRFGIFGFLRPV